MIDTHDIGADGVCSLTVCHAVSIDHTRADAELCCQVVVFWYVLSIVYAAERLRVALLHRISNLYIGAGAGYSPQPPDMCRVCVCGAACGFHRKAI